MLILVFSVEGGAETLLRVLEDGITMCGSGRPAPPLREIEFLMFLNVSDSRRRSTLPS